MSPVLLAPAGLAALTALGLALLVHLARRTEERPTMFAALRWLRPKPMPRRRIRFDEHVLLAVRLGLLTLLALWLARPALLGGEARTAWVAVVPGVDPARATSLVSSGAHGVWLAPGFPKLDTSARAGSVPVASLVRELDADLAPGVALTVLVPPVIALADAAPPRVSHHVAWRIVPGRVADSPTPRPISTTLAIRAAPGIAGTPYLRAAAVALLSPGQSVDIAPASAPLPRSGAVAWWSAGELPSALRDWAARGGTILVPAGAILPPGATATVWRDKVGAPIAEETGIGAGRIVRFTRPLEPAAMPALLEPSFPDRLSALIVAPSSPTRVAAADYAPELGAAPTDRIAAPFDLQPGFAALIAALFLIERWFATRRQRAPTP